LNHDFPGNVRELENIIERAVVFAEDEIVTRSDLPVFLEMTSEKSWIWRVRSLCLKKSERSRLEKLRKPWKNLTESRARQQGF